MKMCAHCKRMKPLTDFYVRTSTKSGRGSYCKPCRRERALTWPSQEREAQRYRQIKHRYGLNRAEYDALLGAQQGRCAICRQEETRAGVNVLAVDHDHRTGTVRGLLCNACNVGLARFLEDPDLLQAAVAYLIAAIDQTEIVVHT